MRKSKEKKEKKEEYSSAVYIEHLIFACNVSEVNKQKSAHTKKEIKRK